MNAFGRLFRVSIFGESHGPGVGVLVDGCPAGLPLTAGDFSADLRRRRGEGAGVTPRREPDEPELLGGIFRGRTTGAPLLLRVANRDVDSSAYESVHNHPRPGHADFTAAVKYGGHRDHRGSGHFSGRVTAGLVMAGTVARRLIEPVEVSARLVEAGGQTDIASAVAEAIADHDSVGGLIECRAAGIPAGLGEPFFDPLEGLLAHILFAIPAVRGVEFGAGFDSARMRGSQCNDPILDTAGRTATNHAGGINGGISNGNEMRFRVAVKPTSSIPRPQRTVDLSTGQPVDLTMGGRHDACIALRLPVVVEAATAIVLADQLLIAGRLSRVWAAAEPT